MSSAVVYLNRGTACYLRLAVSIFSLRKHYTGTIRVYQEGDIDPGLDALVKKHGVELHAIPTSRDPILVVKAGLRHHLVDKYSMFLDSDTLVQANVAEFIEWIREWKYVATWFAGWTTHDEGMAWRLKEWNIVDEVLVNRAFNYGKAINTGVQGWTKNTSILEEYERLTRLGNLAKCNPKILDEIAMQLALPLHPHFLADGSWNTSGEFGDIERARIVHYHGSKHCVPGNTRCLNWKRHYLELIEDFPEHFEFLRRSWGDRALDVFQKELFDERGKGELESFCPPYKE